jgi:hypothetical protein
MPTHRPPPAEQKARFELVLNELNSYSAITEKIKICEKLSINVGKRTRFIHESVVNIWNKFHDPTKLCTLLDEKISKLTVECDNRKAQGKSLCRAVDCERAPRYLDIATEFLRRSYSDEELKIYHKQKPCPISKPVFEHCDKEFLLKFPQYSLQEVKGFRQCSAVLYIKSLINKALLKQGPQDPSSSQTGDLPTPSCHGLGLLARAASDAEKCATLDVEVTIEPPKDPRNLDQLLRAMDSIPEFNDPDSVNDGRGASESLCRSDGYDPGKDRSGSGGRTRRSAEAGPGRSNGARLREQFMRSMTKRYKEIPKLSDSSLGSGDRAQKLSYVTTIT